MDIIETPIFTRQIQAIMPDEEYRTLQNTLTSNPTAGKLIPGSGGLRKLRWKASGRGKRGGSRIIYYWFTKREALLMLLAYKKKEQKDLKPQQIQQLRTLITQELKDG